MTSQTAPTLVDGHGGVPKLEISATSEQSADELVVDFRLDAPADRRICFYDGGANLAIEWPHEPGICPDPESRVAFVRYYRAEVALPLGLAIGGYVIPPVRCLNKGERVAGHFTLGSSIIRIAKGPAGAGIPVKIDLPRQIKIQMTLGYNFEPPSISTQDNKPRATFLAWQHALDSNILSVRRSTCWTLSK